MKLNDNSVAKQTSNDGGSYYNIATENGNLN